MKKQVYVWIGITAITLSVFVLGAKFYNNQSSPKEDILVLDDGRLIRPYSVRLGSDRAPVKLVEFLDPECEACRAMHPIVKQVFSEFPDKVQLVIRYMPYHGSSAYVAQVLEAARDQQKYWETLDYLFLKQPEWGDHHKPRPDLIPGYLQTLGLDVESIQAAVDQKKFLDRVQTDEEDGNFLGVRGTPTFFVNGKKVERMSYEALKEAIAKEL